MSARSQDQKFNEDDWELFSDIRQIEGRHLPDVNVTCIWCSGPLDAIRGTKDTCSIRCRVALHRHRQRNPHTRKLVSLFESAPEDCWRTMSDYKALPLNLPYRGGHVSSHRDSVVQAALSDRRAGNVLREILSTPYQPWSRLRDQRSHPLPGTVPIFPESAPASGVLEEVAA